MELIQSLSSRVEAEQTRKLQELSGTNGSGTSKGNEDFMSFGATNTFSSGGGDSSEIDFERLVKGNSGDGGSSNPLDSGWETISSNAKAQSQSINPPKTASFAWSTPSPTTQAFSGNTSTLKPQPPTSRTITPDLSRFDSLSPTTTQFSQPLQPLQAQPLQPSSNFNISSQTVNYNPTPLQPPPKPQTQSQPFQSFQNPPTMVNWSSAASNPWGSNSTSSMNTSMGNLGNSMATMSLNQQRPATNPQSSCVLLLSHEFQIFYSTTDH
jgi:SCY1-like protein 2